MPTNVYFQRYKTSFFLFSIFWLYQKLYGETNTIATAVYFYGLVSVNTFFAEKIGIVLLRLLSFNEVFCLYNTLNEDHYTFFWYKVIKCKFLWKIEKKKRISERDLVYYTVLQLTMLSMQVLKRTFWHTSNTWSVICLTPCISQTSH